jgi:hypothetical protein
MPPRLEFAAESHLLKLQSLQNEVLRTIGNLPRRTPSRYLHGAFKISYINGFVTELCRQQAEVVQNHENVNVRNVGQGEAQHNIEASDLVEVRLTVISIDSI